MKLAELAVSPGPLSIFHNKYWEIERGPGDKASQGIKASDTPGVVGYIIVHE